MISKLTNEFYGSQCTQSDYLLNGLIADMMEDNKALEWIYQALNVIQGQRPVDLLADILSLEKSVDPILLSKFLCLNRMIDCKIGEIIQTLIQYRAHSSQKDHIMECIISGKNYQGPMYNSIVKEAKMESMDYVRKVLEDVFLVNNAAIDLLKMI